jgi:hypothetical protein
LIDILTSFVKDYAHGTNLLVPTETAYHIYSDVMGMTIAEMEATNLMMIAIMVG